MPRVLNQRFAKKVPHAVKVKTTTSGTLTRLIVNLVATITPYIFCADNGSDAALGFLNLIKKSEHPQLSTRNI